MDTFESPLLRDRAPSVPERVSSFVARQPDIVALRAGNASLTYGELEHRSGRLATYLARAGVGAEIPVAICLRRSVDQITAILAVLRAGGAFLPLDPAWPMARIQALVDDARARVLVAEPDIADQIAGDGCAVIRLDRDAAAIAACNPLPPARRKPGDLAYIIYTSGSTGEPKGAEIADENLLNLIEWHQRTFGIGPTDRASYLAGLGFDAAVWEVWPYLCAGGSVVLPPEAVRSSASLLQRWLIEQRITMAFVPSGLAEAMIAAPWPARPALRYLLTGAETLHRAPVPGLGFTVVNNYGPTECAVVATSAVISAETSGIPPIGRPISNVQVHILGADGRPVPDGEMGEIHIGGAAVGRGYRNRPRLTAERFLTDPFLRNGERLYRTGDLGRRAADGQIFFCGRVDSQVKIRGHRVEPDEIAHALDRHALVRSSAIVVRSSDGAGEELTAYVVPVSGDEPSAEQLREHLAKLLPDYMIPGRFVRLDALPLTANGKLDRQLLPPPTEANALRSASYQGPRTRTEQVLISIFADVLGGRQIGVHDSFFLSGGHSLLGTQIVLRARDAFGIELTLRHLFEAQTVAKLAEKIEQLAAEQIAAMSEEEAERRLAV